MVVDRSTRVVYDCVVAEGSELVSVGRVEHRSMLAGSVSLGLHGVLLLLLMIGGLRTAGKPRSVELLPVEVAELPPPPAPPPPPPPGPGAQLRGDTNTRVGTQ